MKRKQAREQETSACRILLRLLCPLLLYPASRHFVFGSFLANRAKGARMCGTIDTFYSSSWGSSLIAARLLWSGSGGF
jgi:hypothetical protein